MINAQINDTLDSNLYNKRQLVANLELISLVRLVNETINVLQDQAEHHLLKLVYVGSNNE